MVKASGIFPRPGMRALGPGELELKIGLLSPCSLAPLRFPNSVLMPAPSKANSQRAGLGWAGLGRVTGDRQLFKELMKLERSQGNLVSPEAPAAD